MKVNQMCITSPMTKLLCNRTFPDFKTSVIKISSLKQCNSSSEPRASFISLLLKKKKIVYSWHTLNLPVIQLSHCSIISYHRHRLTLLPFRGCHYFGHICIHGSGLDCFLSLIIKRLSFARLASNPCV